MNPVRTATTATAPPDVDPAIEDPALECARLRALLDRQPSCVMRIGTGGTLLAVNEASVSLLGARTLGDVLGTPITDRIDGDGKTWSEFVRRVSQAGSASTECEMTDLAGVQRAIVLQGVALPDHPDAGASLLVAVRDVSTARRLQASLQEQEGLVEELRRELEAARAEREQLRAALSQLKSALNGAIDATLLAQQIAAKGGQS